MGDVLLVCEPRFAEMHLVIDGAGQQITALRIEVARVLHRTDPFRSHAFDPSIAHEHIGLEGGTIVHYLRVTYKEGVHGLRMVKRIFNTPRMASLKMLEFILLVPFTRSLKLMGTSTILKPLSLTRYFISIWNA